MLSVLCVTSSAATVLLLLCIPIICWAGGAGRPMDPQLQEEYCKNFTYGNGRSEFFSPGFPRNYPPGIKCFRTITADYGYFVRIDFRDYFNIEPPTNEGNCDYDFLEVSKNIRIFEGILQCLHSKICWIIPSSYSKTPLDKMIWCHWPMSLLVNIIWIVKIIIRFVHSFTVLDSLMRNSKKQSQYVVKSSN